MKILMIWGQRRCLYPGQYAPELLEAVTEYQDEDNPDFIANAIKDLAENKDFVSGQIISAEVDDEALVAALELPAVELKNIKAKGDHNA